VEAYSEQQNGVKGHGAGCGSSTSAYRGLFLQPKLEKLLCKKLAKNRPIKSEDTNVVVSVMERSQRDLTKRFDDTDIDLTVIERQLVVSGELFRAGKKLRLNLSFNYVETSQPSAISSRKADKRGASSTTQQMLTERAAQLDAEEESSGQPSIWRMVYGLIHVNEVIRTESRQVKVSQISILLLCYPASCFFGPTNGSQRSSYAESCHEHLELVPQKDRHLVLIQIRLFQQVFTQSV
jgi:hypothetical protein